MRLMLQSGGDHERGGAGNNCPRTGGERAGETAREHCDEAPGAVGERHRSTSESAWRLQQSRSDADNGASAT
ncbi:hypothetical protein C6Y62_06160 [Hyphomicrobium sulfonivorans]|nr:hypothetical protein [Hyphomicrobium sulfonivorans]